MAGCYEMSRDGGRCFLLGLWPSSSPRATAFCPLPWNGGNAVIHCHQVTPDATALLPVMVPGDHGWMGWGITSHKVPLPWGKVLWDTPCVLFPSSAPYPQEVSRSRISSCCPLPWHHLKPVQEQARWERFPSSLNHMKCETTFFPLFIIQMPCKKTKPVSSLFLLKVFKIIRFQGKEEEYN